MGSICIKCGKTVEGEGIAFCPYCGEKLAEKKTEAQLSEAEEKWIRKSREVASYPERKKILFRALEEIPDSRAIAWELLFIGEEGPKRARNVDFSVIKCYALEIYRKPGEFSEEKRNRLREKLFGDPELDRCFSLFEDPEQKQVEYLQRLCLEYVEIFLEGNSQLMGNWFGFQLERNKGKKLAVPVAEVIGRINRDNQLTPQQQELLSRAMYRAYAIRMNGNTEPLDALVR